MLYRQGDTEDKDGTSPDEERAQALAVDEKLKKESVRASMLSDILQQKSLKLPMSVERGNVCSYLAKCERYKDHLIIKHSMIALGPENGSCCCDKCAAGRQVTLTTGSPPQQYTLPVGWAQFIHRYTPCHVTGYCVLHIAGLIYGWERFITCSQLIPQTKKLLIISES